LGPHVLVMMGQIFSLISGSLTLWLSVSGDETITHA